MILGGDEIGRTQRGNNNAYCQDNDVSWVDWTHVDQGLHDFTQQLIQLRRAHPVFSRRRWFHGQLLHGSGVSDIGWFRPDGQQMSDEEWKSGFAKFIGVFLNGKAIPYLDERGQRVVDDSFFVVFNAHHEPLEFTLPGREWGATAELLLDTYVLTGDGDRGKRFKAGDKVSVAGRALRLLRYLA
jgi:isoamylase